MLTIMFLAFYLHRDQHIMKLDEHDFSWVGFFCFVFLKKPIVRVKRCLSSLNISVCINSVDVWVSFFFCRFQFQCFRACCGSRTLCNANKSTPSGEVPLRLSEFSELTLTLKYIQKRDY